MEFTRKKINSFDLMKLILAYFVVADHCDIRYEYPLFFNVIKMAVPLFFLMSGYLLWHRLSCLPHCQWGGYFF